MSIQSGLVHVFETAQLRAEMAEGQLDEFSELLAQYFVDEDAKVKAGAEEFLTWVGKMHRETHPLPAATGKERAA